MDLNKLTGRSSHVDLHELIRKIRAAKSSADERKEISQEMANIRSAFKEKKSAQYRLENVAKLMYLDMLGYQTYFGQMEVLKLLAMPGFPEKRVGYLGLMQLLDENTEILQLAPSTIKNDLENPCPQIVSLALTALGHICSQALAYDFATDIQKLIKRSPPAIRKKACLCAARIVQRTGEHFDYLQPAMSIISDKEKYHGLKIAAITLIQSIIRVDERAKKKVRKAIQQFISTLRDLVLSSYDPDYDTSGVTDPFLQVKLLSVMRELAVGDSRTARAIADVLAQVATNTESNKNPGNAILYECVTTILSIEAEKSLRVLAINILGRFLVNRDNNIRYVALNTLQQAVSQNTEAEQAIQRHRSTIVECIKDGDITIRRRALGLVDSLVNKKNVEKLVGELITFVPMAQKEFKKELCEKICYVIHRYSIHMKWNIDAMVEILELSEGLAPSFAADALIGTVARSKDLRNYATHKLYKCLAEDPDEIALRKAALWAVGEFGEMLLTPCQADDGAAFNAVQPQTVIRTLQQNLDNIILPKDVKQYALTAAVKLTSRLPNCNDILEALIDKYSGDRDLELQSRAIEFTSLLETAMNIQRSVLERLPEPPAFEIKQDTKKRSQGDSAAISDDDLDDSNDDDSNDSDDDTGDSDDSNDSDDSSDDKPSRKQQKAHRAQQKAQQAQAVQQSDDLLLDLFGGSTSAPPRTQAPPQQQQQTQQAVDPLAGFFGATPVQTKTSVNTSPLDIFGNNASPVKTQAPVQPVQPGVVEEQIFNERGVSITFKSTKPSVGILITNCIFRNANPFEVTNFNFAVAVPKYMKLALKPAESNVLPANNSGIVKQAFKIQNTLHGQRPNVVKVKVDFVANGAPFTKVFQVTPGEQTSI